MGHLEEQQDLPTGELPQMAFGILLRNVGFTHIAIFIIMDTLAFFVCFFLELATARLFGIHDIVQTMHIEWCRGLRSPYIARRTNSDLPHSLPATCKARGRLRNSLLEVEETPPFLSMEWRGVLAAVVVPPPPPPAGGGIPGPLTTACI
eukprot:scaffold58107_cov70-Cyclotella_meneghiniana.AAC.2